MSQEEIKDEKKKYLKELRNNLENDKATGKGAGKDEKKHTLEEINKYIETWQSI